MSRSTRPWRAAGPTRGPTRRRRRPRDRLGVQQRHRRLGQPRRVRQHRRPRGAGAYLKSLGLRTPAIDAHDARRDRLGHRPDDGGVHPRVRPGGRLRPRRRFLERCRETVAPVRLPSTGCAPCTSPTGTRSTCRTTRPTSCSATSRCSTALDDDAIGLRARRCASSKPGGRIASNFRTRVDADVVLSCRPARWCAPRWNPGVGDCCRARAGRHAWVGRSQPAEPDQVIGPLARHAHRHRCADQRPAYNVTGYGATHTFYGSTRPLVARSPTVVHATPAESAARTVRRGPVRYA